MAKRRKEKDEEEELDFKIPKFDEEKFIKKREKELQDYFYIIPVWISYGSNLLWILGFNGEKLT